MFSLRFFQNGTMSCDQATLWMRPGLPGVEILRARFMHHRFGRHAHEGYVLAVMEEGGEAFEHRGRRYVAPPGSLVLIEPEMAHTGEAAGDRPWSYCALYLSRAWFAGNSPRFALPVIQDPELFERVCTFHRALEDRAQPLWVESELVELLESLRMKHGTSPAPEVALLDHRPGLERVRGYLRSHLRDLVRLQDLAELAGIGKFHLLRMFKRATGFTPYEFLVQARVRRAMELLRSGRSATFAAVETGFADQAHLNRHFKRLVGVPPGLFAKASQHRSSGGAI